VLGGVGRSPLYGVVSITYPKATYFVLSVSDKIGFQTVKAVICLFIPFLLIEVYTSVKSIG
jgi:hypothetical protein